MTKAELIDALREENGLARNEATEVVQLFFDEMSDALAKGDRVELRGLCSFYIKKYRPYTGRNPRSGEKVKIKSEKLPFFRAGRELKKRGKIKNPSKGVWVKA
jgi:integration host factor subunit beta